MMTIQVSKKAIAVSTAPTTIELDNGPNKMARAGTLQEVRLHTWPPVSLMSKKFLRAHENLEAH